MNSSERRFHAACMAMVHFRPREHFNVEAAKFCVDYADALLEELARTEKKSLCMHKNIVPEHPLQGSFMHGNQPPITLGTVPKHCGDCGEMLE